jgi:hypothetical protein
MAVIISNPTPASWDDLEMNWDNPDPNYCKYINALREAILERAEFVKIPIEDDDNYNPDNWAIGYTGTSYVYPVLKSKTIPLANPFMRLDLSILESIHWSTICLIKYFINDTNDDRELWTLDSMMEFLGIDNLISPQKCAFSVQAWVIQTYRILRELRMYNPGVDVEPWTKFFDSTTSFSGGVGWGNQSGFIRADTMEIAMSMQESRVLGHWMNGLPEGIASTQVVIHNFGVMYDNANSHAKWIGGGGTYYLGQNSGSITFTPKENLEYDVEYPVLMYLRPTHLIDNGAVPDFMLALYPPIYDYTGGEYITLLKYMNTKDGEYQVDVEDEGIDINDWLVWSGVYDPYEDEDDTSINGAGEGRYLVNDLPDNYGWVANWPYPANKLPQDPRGFVRVKYIGKFKFKSRIIE